MKKLFLLVLLFSSCNILAQEKKHSNCATDEHHLHQLKVNRDYKKNFEANNIAWQNFALKKLEKKSTQKSETNPVTLSVVFHDLSSSSSTTFLTSSASILEYQYLIDKLNSIYDGTNLTGTPGNNTHISFCIAQKDINGNAYTATMSRVNGVSASANLDKNDPNQLNAIVTASNTIIRFPTKKYINIYIVDSMFDNDVTNDVGIAGFATLPSAHGTTTDGIYVTRSFLMSNNPSLDTNMKMLAHEMGHYLGLFHTFGICDPEVIANIPDCSCDNDNCLFDGDMVCDTQPNKLQMSEYTCTPLSFPNTCSDVIPTITDGNHPQVEVSDPKQNFMDYGNWDCQYQFTSGQIERMNFMIDPEFGPRKSLLGQSECVDCVAINNCTFLIKPFGVTLPVPRLEIIQISSGTPPVQFDWEITCTPSASPAMNYFWTLELLGNPNQIIFENVLASSYTTTSSLVPGNYRLKMTAILQSNTNCKEYATYDFSIYPMAGECNLILPSSNTTWVNEGWQRTLSENGWINVMGSYPAGSSQYEDGDPDFDDHAEDAYDVIPLTSGQVIPNDPNFSSITLPNGANIDRIIRVGKKSGGGGKAYYATITLPVTSNNCKYRIWYLGKTEGAGGGSAYPFINNNTNNNAAFGWVCQYNYNSPVTTITSQHNSTIGHNNTNFFRYYDVNDMISLRGNSSGFTNGRTDNWLSRGINFSEFVNLTPNTEITITFFAHSNIASEAQENAYGYYGIECLGGGTPGTYSFDIEDKSIPCNSPEPRSCTEIIVPLPKVVDFYGFSTSPAYNFQDVKFYKKLPNGSYDPEPYDIQSISTNITNHTRTYELCLDKNILPIDIQGNQSIQEFKVIAKTLHTTVEDTFRVYIGFYNNLSDCTNGDQIDTSLNPDIVNGNILVCETDNLPTLILTDTCISVPHTFQWYNGSSEIWGATDNSLQLTVDNFNPGDCNVYYRKTLYKEPYCGNEKFKKSEEFHIYSYGIEFFGLAKDKDMCIGDTYQLEIFNPVIQASCNIPNDLLSNVNTQNNLTFQMFDPISNQAIGTIFNYSFDGQIS